MFSTLNSAIYIFQRFSSLYVARVFDRSIFSLEQTFFHSLIPLAWFERPWLPFPCTNSLAQLSRNKPETLVFYDWKQTSVVGLFSRKLGLQIRALSSIANTRTVLRYSTEAEAVLPTSPMLELIGFGYSYLPTIYSSCIYTISSVP